MHNSLGGFRRPIDAELRVRQEFSSSGSISPPSIAMAMSAIKATALFRTSVMAHQY
jgi:hypothetical protein